MAEKKMTPEELRRYKNDANVAGLAMLHPPKGKEKDEKKKSGGKKK